MKDDQNNTIRIGDLVTCNELTRPHHRVGHQGVVTTYGNINVGVLFPDSDKVFRIPPQHLRVGSHPELKKFNKIEKRFQENQKKLFSAVLAVGVEREIISTDQMYALQDVLEDTMYAFFTRT